MRRGLVIVVLLALPVFAAAQSRAHMEACVRWTLTGNRYVTRNSCDTPVSILFMTLSDGHVVAKDIQPGGRFESDPLGDKANEMMFTVCPVSYQPNLRFTAENAEPISVSLYNCVPPGKPTS
jgi:hypothetical protein